MRKMSALGESCRSGRSPELGVMLTTRDRPRSGHHRPEVHHAVVRHDDQPVDLLIAVVGEREHRPVVAGLASAHLDAADDSVGAGRGRHLDAVAFGFEPLHRLGEVDRRGVDAHIDRLDGARDIRARRDAEQNRHRDHGAQQTQNFDLPAWRMIPNSAKRFSGEIMRKKGARQPSP